MKRRCGNCFFGKKTSPEALAILCFGAPPTVTARAVDEKGTESVTTTPPVLDPYRAPCALHVYRFSPKGILRRLMSVA